MNDDDEQQLRKQERWKAAVYETMDVWNVPREEAEEIVNTLHWEIQDRQMLSFAKAAMPKWQAAIEDAAWQIADLISLDTGLLSPIAVGRLRAAIRDYDARLARKQAEEQRQRAEEERLFGLGASDQEGGTDDADSAV